ncbi:MAG: type I-C CRISPR-associated endonuclease Cas1c [Gammaproteobacteria bacterium]|nr:type I-C CRISPR-associated endonuclease Cas1c [Gammaproteobacteria bacterium]
MRRHLNTLYVTTENAWLHKDGENIVVKVDGSEQARVPIHILGSVVCIGTLGATPALLGHCARKGVSVTFTARSGRFLARMEGPTTGNVLLRRTQYRAADNTDQLGALASHIVAGKIHNQRTVVRRALRDHGATMGADGRERLRACEQRLTNAARRAAHGREVDSVRGVEGEAARAYYEVFGDLTRREDGCFAFDGRSRRPPLNPMNALLSFLYTLLVHDCRSALEAAGLDPAVGFLHSERPGRPSLALDLMEELRPAFADRLALSLVNRRQLSGDDFATAVSGAVTLDERARKSVIVAYQTRKQDELTHPFLQEKTTWGLVPFIQAKQFAAHLRGDLDAYPPFLWR